MLYTSTFSKTLVITHQFESSLASSASLREVKLWDVDKAIKGEWLLNQVQKHHDSGASLIASMQTRSASSVTILLSLCDLQAWHKAAQWLLPEFVRSWIICFCTTWCFSVDLNPSLPDAAQVSQSIWSDLFCCHYQHSWGSWEHQQLFCVTTTSCETTEISWWLLSCHTWTSKLCYKTCLLERQR